MRGLLLTHVDGHPGVLTSSRNGAEARTALALLLGNLVGAFFLHRLSGFLLGRFLLCQTLSHFVSPPMNG